MIRGRDGPGPGLQSGRPDMIESSPYRKAEKTAMSKSISDSDYNNIPKIRIWSSTSAGSMKITPIWFAPKILGLPILNVRIILDYFVFAFGRLCCWYTRKTTTFSMIAALLHYADFDWCVSIGGKLPEIGGNACLGDSTIVIESREYALPIPFLKHPLYWHY